MSGKTKFDEHSDLVERMAGTLGVDLDAAMMAGRWTPDDLLATVARCLGCTDPDECRGWLDDNSTGAAEPPRYCRNKDILETLRGHPAPA